MGQGVKEVGGGVGGKIREAQEDKAREYTVSKFISCLVIYLIIIDVLLEI